MSLGPPALYARGFDQTRTAPILSHTHSPAFSLSIAAAATAKLHKTIRWKSLKKSGGRVHGVAEVFACDTSVVLFASTCTSSRSSGDTPPSLIPNAILERHA
eukprot:3864279-Rhodomonas_salina.1